MIIILSLLVLYLIVDTIRDSFKKKWYKRGYLEACRKYDNTDYMDYDEPDYSKEASKKFDDEYGFKYD